MRISKNGRVTIPARVRRSLGLAPHSEVEFVVQDGVAAIRRKDERRTIGELTVRRLKQGPKMTMTSRELLELLRDENDVVEGR